MKSSSAALRLKLKQEQADDGSEMQESGGLSSSLELRLGISSDNNDPWLGVGVHPWSLASRQAEKAAMEQAHQRPPPPQPVGWPPVGAFRKSHLASTKAAAEEPSKAVRSGERPAASMFVKVNLEGCSVGRKVDLLAHQGYASLSRALQAMFHGFMSGQDLLALICVYDGQWRIAAGREDNEEETTTKDRRKTHILLYEDNEGDRMLVGDVPWE
ncbi:hypothetical protein HU200_052288 [Digitaria exilis]|uniref:Auxin-responsive protein n=1 Tax=Digitaria exilis TaxID=1010633 RepID=A0A835E8U7_9POAL|nr:hypothetical protein HU200_052288 [Digitaria exilis]